MNITDFLKNKWNNISARIFLIITLLLIILYLSFSMFFIFNQTRALKANLITEGKTLTELFAHNCRLGLFAENSALLKDPLEGIMNHNNIILIQAFTDEYRELLKRKCNNHNEYKNVPGVYMTVAELKKNTRISSMTDITHITEYDDVIAFIRPVTSRTNLVSSDIYSRSTPVDKRHIIGFVRVVFSTKTLKDELNGLIFKGIIIPVFFMMPIWLVIFYTVKNATRPLKNLTRSVTALGEGKDVELVEVETDNEIGNLARAFNRMVISLKKKEKEKQHVEKQLRQSQKMEAVGTLAGGIAHDFNNILSVIAGYAELLRKNNNFSKDSKQYIDNLLTTTEKAALLIKGLLAFTRQQNIVLRPVSLNDAVANFERNMLRLFRRNLEFRLELSESNPIVMSDTLQIEQVLLNLSLNAKDAMPGGGVLTISTDSVNFQDCYRIFSGLVPPGRYAVLSVNDTGTGMDRKTMERIFDPFFTTKESSSGTGLGLSMVYGIVRQHRGFIDVKSTPGRGTKFRIYLKRVNAEVLPEKISSLNSPPEVSETILMAGGDREYREVTARVLREAGYSVITASDGNEALKLFKEQSDKFDFLLYDLMLSEKNSMNTYDDIKKIKPGIKVLFLGDHAEDAVLKNTCHENLQPIILKPIMPEELLERIRELLDK